jgi:hypothetical protein
MASRNLKLLIGTQWATTPTRQGLATHRKRVLRRRQQWRHEA